MNRKYKIAQSTKFKKDLKIVIKRGYDLSLIEEVIEKLAYGKRLPDKYKDHTLSGDYDDYRECHITPDWLLIWNI